MGYRGIADARFARPARARCRFIAAGYDFINRWVSFFGRDWHAFDDGVVPFVSIPCEKTVFDGYLASVVISDRRT